MGTNRGYISSEDFAKYGPGGRDGEQDMSQRNDQRDAIAAANAHLINADLPTVEELLEVCFTLIKSDDLQAAIDKARAAVSKVWQ